MSADGSLSAPHSDPLGSRLEPPPTLTTPGGGDAVGRETPIYFESERLASATTRAYRNRATAKALRVERSKVLAQIGLLQDRQSIPPTLGFEIRFPYARGQKPLSVEGGFAKCVASGGVPTLT